MYILSLPVIAPDTTDSIDRAGYQSEKIWDRLVAGFRKGDISHSVAQTHTESAVSRSLRRDYWHAERRI